jgi:LPXTG-motif cell wall-anchored protein
MRTMRGLGVALVAGLLTTAFIAGPASADTPEAFVGNAAGRALGLNVLGTDLTFGVSSANVTAPINALAKGVGQLLPSVVASQQSTASTDNSTDSKPLLCGPISLPSQLSSIITLDTACSQTLAAVTGGLAHASSLGSVASLSLSANTILSQLPIQSTLAQVLTPLTHTNTPLDPVTTSLEQLVTSVLNTKTLDVSLGKSTSDVLTTATGVTSTATADGADVKILPTPAIVTSLGLPDLKPVAEIIVSSSKAVAAYDRGTGVATPSFDAALVTINLNPTLAGALGVPASLSIKPGVTQTILAGTPLESTITVANGSTSKDANGTVHAVADGVSLQLLKGINGGIALALAHSEANVVGAPAVVAPVQQAVVKAVTLPRTGGPSPWVPFAGAGLLGAAILVRRIRVARD